MKTYGRPHNGFLVEIILPRKYEVESPSLAEGEPSRIGQEIPIEERYPPNSSPRL